MILRSLGISVRLKRKNIIYTTDEIRFRADFVIKTELLKEYGIREWAFDVYVGPHRPVMQNYLGFRLLLCEFFKR